MTEKEKNLFEDLSITHMDSLYTNAIRLTRSAIGAEYLVQKTYAYAFCFFHQYNRNTNFGDWLNEVLIMVYINDHPSVHESEFLNSVQIAM